MRAVRVMPPLRPLAVLGAGAVACLLLSGCSTSSPQAAASTRSSSSTTTQATPPPPPPAPTIAITPKDGSAEVRLDQPVTVAVDAGLLDNVTLHTDADRTALPGKLSTDGRTWTATTALDPRVHYVVEAAAHDAGGTSTAQASFTTMTVAQRLTTDVFPGDGAVVGVGMPIQLTFNVPVARERQANLVSHIQVQTSTPIAGAWHWFSASEVHWRPKTFWPAGTKVTVNANLTGVDVGNGTWAVGNWSSSFSVGDKHYSVIDVASHQMQVFQNDQLIHTYPVSTGSPSHPTLGGTLFVWYKLQHVRMVSTSIGIPVNAPNGYDQTVYWDTAISTNGFYIHAAPWSVWAQGSQNVSHGCVNLSPERAIEFYNFSLPGDVVVVKNTPRVADAGDGEGDWQVPFEQFANSGGTVAPTTAPTQAGGL